jgi:hypothetical protein
MNKISFILKKDGTTDFRTFEYDDQFNFDVVTLNGYEYLNFNEIVKDIISNRVDADSLSAIKDTNIDDLIGFHLNGGMWIRNSYGLWADANPYTRCDEADGDTHPDQFSMTIIERIHQLLIDDYDRAKEAEKTKDDYDRAMEIV